MRSRGFNLLNILAIIPIICCLIVLIYMPLGESFLGLFGMTAEAYDAFTDMLIPVCEVVNIILYISMALQTVIALGMIIFGRKSLANNTTYLALTIVDFIVFIITMFEIVILAGSVYS